MKHATRWFLMVVLLSAFAATGALANEHAINGVPSDEPIIDSIPYDGYDEDRDNIIDVEFVDFDDMAAPCFFSDQVPLSNEYATQGIIFSGLGEVLDECGNFGISNYSSPNFLAFNTGGGVSGPEDLLFNTPINSFSLYAGHSSAGTISMRAYNAANVLIDSDAISGTSNLAQMSVSAPGIVRIHLSFSGSIACFDDLMWDDTPQTPLILELTPFTSSVPASGGNVQYLAEVTNFTNSPITLDAWIQIEHVMSGNTVETRFWPNRTYPPNATSSAILNQYIPAIAPGGSYNLIGILGNHPWAPMYWDMFPFVKTGPSTDGMQAFEQPELWPSTGSFAVEETFAVTAEGESLPQEFALGAAYPNPFNPSTTLSVNLPETAELTVAVYNVVGQQVAELAHGTFNAGSHMLTFDASNLSGGVYFVHASANGWNAVQKVVLMK